MMNQKAHENKPAKTENSRDAQKATSRRVGHNIIFFIDTILEKISVASVRIVLIVINVVLLAFFVIGLILPAFAEKQVSAEPEKTEKGEKDGKKEKLYDDETLEKALTDAMQVKLRKLAPRYSFDKINSWGNIKISDEMWFKRAFYDEYAFVLNLLNISKIQDTQKQVDSVVSRMKVYFNEREIEQSVEFLEKYFREYLLLRAYDTDSQIPAEIINNLGGSEVEVAFLVYAVLSKLGVTPEIYGDAEGNRHFYFVFEKTQYMIYFTAEKPSKLGQKLAPEGIIEAFLTAHANLESDPLKKIQIYKLLEDLTPTTDIYRALYGLYDELSKIVETDALKQEYNKKKDEYLRKLPMDKPDDFYLIARRDFNANNIEEAWRIFNELATQYPDFMPKEGESPYYYLSLMASAKFEDGAVSETLLMSFLNKLDYEKEHYVALLSKSAYLLLNRQKFAESLEILNKLELHGHADKSLYLARNRIYAELKQNIFSISNLKAAVALDPSDRELRVKLIQQLIDTEMYAEALAECNNAAMSKAKMTFALKVGAEIAERYLNDITLAAEMLTKYLQLNPDDEEAQKKLAEYVR